jgi:tRNA U34 5-methylaminomethyl-2-thiouridine-forming methyltransferase MnmC
MKPEIRPIKSADGSFTLKNLSLNEHYHSLDGAIRESFHVYIQHGLLEISKTKKEIKVFELGLGLGYNAFLTLKTAIEKSLRIEYYCSEIFPIGFETILSWGIPEAGIEKKDRNLYKEIHQADWETKIVLNSNFCLFKTKEPIETLNISELMGSIDVLYFDAFAPSKQPDIWRPELLKKCSDLLQAGGIFVTYCSQGQFKRDLSRIGFRLENKPGFGKKREMTVGTKF